MRDILNSSFRSTVSFPLFYLFSLSSYIWNSDHECICCALGQKYLEKRQKLAQMVDKKLVTGILK